MNKPRARILDWRPLRRNSLVGFARVETTGEPKWQPILDFANHVDRLSWSRQVLAALAADDPDALEESDET